MRKNKRKLETGAGTPLPAIKRTDASGNSSESYLRALRRSRKSVADLTLTEIRNIEARVRKELYP